MCPRSTDAIFKSLVVKMKSSLILAVFAILVCFQIAFADTFRNPILKNDSSGCVASNINPKRFSPSITAANRLEVCRAVDDVARRLRETRWSATLVGDLVGVWTVFAGENVFFTDMEQGAPREMLALAEAFPSKRKSGGYEACVHLKNGISEKDWFYHVLLHELRHLYDYYNVWRTGRNIPPYEYERRAFEMLSMVDQETPPSQRHSKMPQLWQDKWNALGRVEAERRREKAIADYLKSVKFYRDLPQTLPDVPIDVMSPEQLAEDEKNYARPKLIRRRPRVAVPSADGRAGAPE